MVNRLNGLARKRIRAAKKLCGLWNSSLAKGKSPLEMSWDSDVCSGIEERETPNWGFPPGGSPCPGEKRDGAIWVAFISSQTSLRVLSAPIPHFVSQSRTVFKSQSCIHRPPPDITRGTLKNGEYLGDPEAWKRPHRVRKVKKIGVCYRVALSASTTLSLPRLPPFIRTAVGRFAGERRLGSLFVHRERNKGHPSHLTNSSSSSSEEQRKYATQEDDFI